MNDFIDAIKGEDSSEESESVDPSTERYDELKREESGVEKGSPAERRYQKIKDEAKEELINNKQEKQEDSEGEDDGFITH